MKIFSVLKIIAITIIVKTSRGTQKQTAEKKAAGVKNKN
jgi:hypothetical protein